jgi:hypothetical protein
VGFGLRAATAAGPARQAQTYAQQIEAAQKEADLTKKSAAMLALVRQALGPTLTVQEAGTSSKRAVDPADYAATPAINFDVNLNSKTKWKSSKVATDNAGYTFHVTKGSVVSAYVILGPKSLSAKGVETTQMFAAHELFHADHQAMSKASYEDDEVEAWTDSFVRFFLPTWLKRRLLDTATASKKLMTDLSKALKITAPSGSSAPPTP